jgi:DNA (cytosine-5)-methyltransferase 1
MRHPKPLKTKRSHTIRPISAVDLFCGAGGLTHGLRNSGIDVAAGIDVDSNAQFAYESNNPGSKFYCWDLAHKNCRSIEALFRPGAIRLLAGCAPCQPFSKLTNGRSEHRDWNLLNVFSRFIRGILPEIVTMENVPELAGRGGKVFKRFVKTLVSMGYHIDWDVLDCRYFGVPQSRRRLVLLASRIGVIRVPEGKYRYPSQWKTVRRTIGTLRRLHAGQADRHDPLHTAPRLSPRNLQRIRATPHNGGMRRDWPKRLALDCHKKESGKSYQAIYGRMWWDKPAPTMTTLCTGIGNGRFGHPKQDRSITLREAALFQSFPRKYNFWPSEKAINRSAVGKLIGNAVPPKLGKAIGKSVIEHVRSQSLFM